MTIAGDTTKFNKGAFIDGLAAYLHIEKYRIQVDIVSRRARLLRRWLTDAGSTFQVEVTIATPNLNNQNAVKQTLSQATANQLSSIVGANVQTIAPPESDNKPMGPSNGNVSAKPPNNIGLIIPLVLVSLVAFCGTGYFVYNKTTKPAQRPSVKLFHAKGGAMQLQDLQPHQGSPMGGQRGYGNHLTINAETKAMAGKI